MALKISGIGLICGLGDSPELVYHNACCGRDTFRDIYSFDKAPYAQKRAGQLEPAVSDRLAAEYEDEDRALAMALNAGKQALENQPENARRGLVLATNFGPMETLQWAWAERLDTGSIDDYTFAPASDYVSRIAAKLGCGGPAAQISMSCASGAAALAVAKDMIADGRADSVLVIAYDSLSEYCWCGLSNLHTVTTGEMRPFDARRSGTIFSEGAAAMLVEKDDGKDARYGWLNGAATNNNAFHLTAPRQEGEGSRLVMQAALEDAGIPASDIGHICAHATSTNANDLTEAQALRNLFGERLPSITVAAHKSQLGHLLGAAGLAEAILTLLSMRNGCVPPTLRHEQPDPRCMPLDCVPLVKRNAQFRTAITNSAGIGGNNAALVLADHRTAHEPRQPRKVYLQNIGWVLPGHIGAGLELLQHPEWLQNHSGASLENFNAKEYLNSVKGYLDPAGAFVLAATRLAFGDEPTHGGMAAATCFGSSKSAFTFYSQFHTKGPRLASPLIFPHGYANTPSNLAAIEFGFDGPHQVFYGLQDVREAFRFACDRIRNGETDEMTVACFEAFHAPAYPDSWSILSGAVAFRLTAADTGRPFATPDFWQASASREGAVQALQNLLCFL